MLEFPVFATNRLIVRLPNPNDIAEIIRYYRRNEAFLTPFEPSRPKNFYTAYFWAEQIEKSTLEFSYDRALRLLIFKRTEPEQIIGTANFTQILQSVSFSCNLGYSLAELEQGQGYMTEALQVGIRYVFDQLNLHRIAANYMPHNQRSANVLKRLGFVVEGYAKDYLLINGQWADHVLTSLTHPHWQMK